MPRLLFTCNSTAFFDLRYLIDSVFVTPSFKLLKKPGIENHFCQLDTHYTGTHSQHISIIMLTR